MPSVDQTSSAAADLAGSNDYGSCAEADLADNEARDARAPNYYSTLAVLRMENQDR